MTPLPDAFELPTNWKKLSTPIMLHVFLNRAKSLFVNCSCSVSAVSRTELSFKGRSDEIFLGLEGAIIEVKDFRDIPREFEIGSNIGDHAIFIRFEQFNVEICVYEITVLSKDIASESHIN